MIIAPSLLDGLYLSCCKVRGQLIVKRSPTGSSVEDRFSCPLLSYLRKCAYEWIKWRNVHDLIYATMSLHSETRVMMTERKRIRKNTYFIFSLSRCISSLSSRTSISLPRRAMTADQTKSIPLFFDGEKRGKLYTFTRERWCRTAKQSNQDFPYRPFSLPTIQPNQHLWWQRLSIDSCPMQARSQ